MSYILNDMVPRHWVRSSPQLLGIDMWTGQADAIAARGFDTYTIEHTGANMAQPVQDIGHPDLKANTPEEKSGSLILRFLKKLGD